MKEGKTQCRLLLKCEHYILAISLESFMNTSEMTQIDG